MRKAFGQWLAAMLLTGIMTACSSDTVYSRFVSTDGTSARHPLPQWHMDSVARFDYTITDAGQDYRLLLYVRHTETYPYQNMWLFVSDSLHTDTIEFYLADDRGQWLGNKHHGFIEMPVLYEENYRFPASGTYRLNVQHGMRDTLLRGVSDIGLEIIRN